MHAVAEIVDGTLRNRKYSVETQRPGLVLHKAAHRLAIPAAFVILLDKQAAQLGTGFLCIGIQSHATHDGIIERIDVVTLQILADALIGAMH